MITAALWLPIETLAKTTSYLLLGLFCLVNLALINIKRRDSAEVPAFSVPMWVPIAGSMSCALFLAIQTASIVFD
jgi:hypothetical protein